MDPAAQPLPLRLLIDEAFRHLRRHFLRLYPAVAIPLALISGLVPVGQILGFGSVEAGQGDPFASLPGILATVALSLVFLVVYVLGNAALLLGSVDALKGEAVSMARAWGAVLAPRVQGTVLLTALVVGLGFVFCCLPGIYAGVVLCLVVPVMAVEKRFGVEALNRSYGLTTYNPQRDIAADPRVKAFLILFVGWLIESAIGMLVGMPVVVLQQYLMFRGASSGAQVDPGTLMAQTMWLQVPANVLGTLARVAVSVYVSLALTLLFFDLLRRREGSDLESAIAGLGGGMPSPGAGPR